jgi:hypothetical protein
MTKKIKNFGVSIGGGRARRQSRIPGQGSKAATGNDRKELGEEYSKADRIKEEGVYSTQPRVSHNRKKQYQLSRLTSVKRTGPEYLPGGRHADERDFKALGIKGVEFGVSLSDEEAQEAMDACYLALCDLARVLNIDKKEVSLGGTLSLYFGARGHGGAGPVTYDPKYQVINFTREGGAGSLAHEWAHALDYYIGKACRLGRDGTGAAVSGCPGMEGVPPSVNELLWGMVSRREPLTNKEQLQIMEEISQNRIREEEIRCGEILQSVIPNTLTDQQQTAWNRAVWEVYDTRRCASLDMYVLRNYPNRAIEELSRVHKEITGHAIPKDKKRRLNYAFASLARIEEIPVNVERPRWREHKTEFYKNSWEMDKRYAKTIHGRYSDNCERLARAFEAYVADKLEKEGNQSQYLTAHSEDVVFVRENGESVYGGPVGEEKAEINRRFDVMFWELKEMRVFRWENIEEGKVYQKTLGASKNSKRILIRC